MIDNPSLTNPRNNQQKETMASLVTNTSDKTGGEDGKKLLKIKFGKETYLFRLSENENYESLLTQLSKQTEVHKEKIKLFGLKAKGGLKNETLVGDMKIPKLIKMMGTKETVLKKEQDREQDAKQELNVLNDMNIYELDLDFNKGNIMEKLKDSIAKTEISSRMMNNPRPNFPLLVLDLDHTLLDFDSKSSNFNKMKRPYMQEFLSLVYKQYDIVIWSQTSWKWLEIKLIELGFLEPSNPYKILFVLDKECMFRRKSRISKTSGKKKKGKAFKPLELIWSKFPRYSRKNTLHVDDVEANFGFNPKNGIKCSCWRSDQVDDCELLKIAHYLKLVAKSGKDMAEFNDNNMNWFKVMNEELMKQSKQNNNDNNTNSNNMDIT